MEKNLPHGGNSTSNFVGKLWTVCRRFDAAAPAHLRAALTLASVSVAVVLPRLRGHRNGLAGLPPDEADDVMRQAARIPGLSSLLEVVKVVACFAYFADPRVQAAVRAQQ